MIALTASKESFLWHPSDFDYNFYVDSLYKSDAIELSYFKCVAFLEGYHRYLIEANGKSRIKTQKEVYSDSIMNLLKRADVFQSDKFQDLLNRFEIKELNLAHRLREIWEFHKELISLNVPVTTFFSQKEICNTGPEGCE